MLNNNEINIAIVGIGNCASSLYQGFIYYKNNKNNGIMKSNIGEYKLDCFKIVCAFDIDKRKVNKTLKQAILSQPNCTPLFINKDEIPDGPIVNMGNVLDGVANHMLNEPEESSFRILQKNGENYPCSNVVEILKKNKVDILINYLPVGSQKATEFYTQCCLDSGVSLLNCIPVFIASNPIWEQKFIDAKIPLIGDDMKSQFGASILSQMLQELSFYRGHKVKCHIQRNIGGNTDFLNMTDKTRLESKKISKENVIKCQNTIHNIPINDTFFHAGPSEYIKYHNDNKIANIHLELEGFMNSPVILDAQLSVIDSPNSAGVVIDAIRYLKVAREMGLCGSLRGPSSFTQKSPPIQLSFEDTLKECNALANRELTKLTRQQKIYF